MNTEPVIVESLIDAPVSKAWKALTENEKLQKWYFQLPEFHARPGFEFRFLGGKDVHRQYLHICKITEVVKEKKLAYS
jgi:uncharacterized protein YndB with AHSA1/START domain